MSNPLKRFGEWKIVAVYNNPAKLASLRNEWATYVKQGQVFCPSGACPFVPGDKFEYDLENFLYYRARAITGDEVNLNGDLFPHDELKASYASFIGKGIYFNHDSQDPEKAFGIILDAMYTPTLYNNDGYEDKYIEILGAIDRKAIEAKRPGLLKDIESGRVTSTSMGTIAQRAKCSICGNIATNCETLCNHVDPRSPLYMKGRNVLGKACFETNYGLTFVEDSIVYVPADPTAHMLEVYASHTNQAYPELGRLSDIFAKYSNARGRKLNLTDPAAVEHFKNTGGLIMEKQAATSEFKHTKDPQQHLVAPYQESIKELNEEISDSGAKSLDQKIRRIIEEEIRKFFAPMYEQVDKALRPDIRNKVQQELAKVKQELSDVLPGAAQAISEAPLPKGEEPVKPAPEPKPEAPKMSSLIYVEDFSTWADDDKQKLIQAVTNKATYEFKGVLESQNPSEEGK